MDPREARDVASAARLAAAQARQQGAQVGQGAARFHGGQLPHPEPVGNRAVTFVVVAVILVGTLATMILLGR